MKHVSCCIIPTCDALILCHSTCWSIILWWLIQSMDLDLERGGAEDVLEIEGFKLNLTTFWYEGRYAWWWGAMGAPEDELRIETPPVLSPPVLIPPADRCWGSLRIEGTPDDVLFDFEARAVLSPYPEPEDMPTGALWEWRMGWWCWWGWCWFWLVMEHLHFGSGRALLGPKGRPVRGLMCVAWPEDDLLSLALVGSESICPLIWVTRGQGNRRLLVEVSLGSRRVMLPGRSCLLK